MRTTPPFPRPRGFTLIELMIVVAIIAIIAAIAIPSLLRSRIAANEVSCQGALKQIVSTESVWRQTASTRNGIQDYWTRDVAGFYARTDAAGNPYQYIDIAFAKADQTGAATYPAVGATSAKAGYWFTAMTTDENGQSYKLDTDSNGVLCANLSKFGFCGYPQTYNSTGVRIYIVNEAGVIWERDRGTALPRLSWPTSDPSTRGWTAAD